MDTKTLTAVIAAIVSVCCALISVFGNLKIAKDKIKAEEDRGKREKLDVAEKVISKYREPLAHSAYDLQAKIYNIIRQGLLQVYYVNGNNEEREYSLKNTVYVIAQYLCWKEIIRREIQYFDLGEIENTRKLTELMDEIQKYFLTDMYSPLFRVFKGEQRAIGEKMIVEENGTLSCMGYALFVENNDEKFLKWFSKLEKDVDLLSQGNISNAERLFPLHHAVIDLINFLDENHVRFPVKYLSKI